MRTRRHLSSSDPMSSTGGHRPESPDHRTVLLQESVELLDIQKDDIVLDATLGGAGHGKEIIRLLGTKGVFIGLDADADAIARAREALVPIALAEVHLIEGNFRNVESYLGKHAIQGISKALFDLGWSGYQLAAGRGFSFLKDEPLLMTFARNPGENDLTAERIVNTWKEESLADVFYGWGEERYSRQIARGIVKARRQGAIVSSKVLGEIIAASVPAAYRRGRLHPATKTFQALRIAVNDEMGALKQGLQGAWKLLKSGGRLAVISFHSTEDREVKKLMLAWSSEGEGMRLTKSPIVPSRDEVRSNPRSRSGKLRVIQKK